MLMEAQSVDYEHLTSRYNTRRADTRHIEVQPVENGCGGAGRMARQ